jgi:hypothetical protein
MQITVVEYTVRMGESRKFIWKNFVLNDQLEYWKGMVRYV